MIQKTTDSLFVSNDISDRHLIARTVCTQPLGYRLPHALLEGEAEGAVAAVAAVAGELSGADDSPGIGSLLAECDEMIDAQRVDIVIVSRAMIREILAEIEAVGTYGLSQLRDGQVVLQVELRVDTVLGQRSGNDGIQVITALAHHVPLALWRGVGSEAGVGRKGIAPPHHQVDARNECRYRPSSVEHKQQYLVESYLSKHIRLQSYE